MFFFFRFFKNQIHIWEVVPCMFSDIAQERTSFEAVALSYHICWDVCVSPSGVWSPQSVLFAASRDNLFGFLDEALRLNLGRVCCFLCGRHVVCQSICQKGGFTRFRCGGLFFPPRVTGFTTRCQQRHGKHAQGSNWKDDSGISSVNRQKRDSATGFITPLLCCYVTAYVIRIELSVLDVTQLPPRTSRMVWFSVCPISCLFFFFPPKHFLGFSLVNDPLSKFHRCPVELRIASVTEQR